jgi:phosphoglycolate phosphatase
MPKDACVLFDLDGTVIDSTEAIVESFGVAFDHFGDRTPEPQAIISLIGHPLVSMFEKLGVASYRAMAYVDVYRGHYRTVCHEKTHLLPGVEAALKAVAPLAVLGVVTTKTARFSRDILDHLGVGSYFETIVGYEEVENAKPHPEPIELALKRLNHPKGPIYMIGDTPLDMIAAKAAGVHPIGVLSGYASKEEMSGYTDSLLPGIKEACSHIVKELAN